MTTLTEAILARIQRETSASSPLSPIELEAIEFLAGGESSLDDVAEETLQAWIKAVGGVDEFCRLRTIVESSKRDAAVTLIKNEMRKQWELSEESELLPISDRIREMACQVLGWRMAELELQQQLLISECVAAAHRALLVELANEYQQQEGQPLAKTTILASDRTTIVMARNNPDWVLSRDRRLESLAQFNREQARIYCLSEHAGCQPADIAEMFVAEGPAESWNLGRVERELDAARAYCFA